METNLGACYFDHFERFFGAPIGVKQYGDTGTSRTYLQVLFYKEMFGGCRPFCTLGLTHYPDALGHLAEVFLPIDEGWPDVPDILCKSFDYMVHHPRGSMVLHRGSALSGVENMAPRFAEQCGKTALYFTEPYGLPDDFNLVPCGDQRGHVFLAIFISQAEFDFLAEHGHDAFETLLENKGVDPFILRRASCV